MEVINDLEKSYPFIVALTFGFVVQCQVMKNNVENTIHAFLTAFRESNWTKDEFNKEYPNLIKSVSNRGESKILRNFMFLFFFIELLIIILAKINEHSDIFKENKIYVKFAFLTNILVFFTFSICGLIMSFKNPYGNLYSSNWE